jgi:hypothetical protein
MLPTLPDDSMAATGSGERRRGRAGGLALTSPRYFVVIRNWSLVLPESLFGKEWKPLHWGEIADESTHGVAS